MTLFLPLGWFKSLTPQQHGTNTGAVNRPTPPAHGGRLHQPPSASNSQTGRSAARGRQLLKFSVRVTHVKKHYLAERLHNKSFPILQHYSIKQFLLHINVIRLINISPFDPICFVSASIRLWPWWFIRCFTSTLTVLFCVMVPLSFIDFSCHNVLMFVGFVCQQLIKVIANGRHVEGTSTQTYI